jgi:hypothetical protein
VLRIWDLVLRTFDLVLRIRGPVLRIPSPVLRMFGPVLRIPDLVLRIPSLVLRIPSLVLRIPGLVLRIPGLQVHTPTSVLHSRSVGGRTPRHEVDAIRVESRYRDSAVPAPELTHAEWRKLTRRALGVARKFRPDDHIAAKELVRRALAHIFRPEGPGHTERDPDVLFKLLARRIWSDAGNDSQRFDPIRTGKQLDDDTWKHPEGKWHPGYIPNPQQLLLAKEQHELGTARYEKLLIRMKGDDLALLLLDTSFERDEARAEALRRGYTERKVNDARRRLQRNLATLVEEERKR